MDGEGDEESVVVEAVMGNLQSFLQTLGKPQLLGLQL